MRARHRPALTPSSIPRDSGSEVTRPRRYRLSPKRSRGGSWDRILEWAKVEASKACTRVYQYTAISSQSR